MGQIAWSEDAERWLREIYEYIGEGSPQSALRTVAGIRERVQYLEFFQNWVGGTREVTGIFESSYTGIIELLIWSTKTKT
jgi:hypothetical protein